MISSRLNGLSRLMIVKGPEGPFQWTYGTVTSWTMQWARLGSIDALNGWRIRGFSPGSAVVGIYEDKFFLGHLNLSDLRGIKSPKVRPICSSGQKHTLHKYTNALHLLKEKGYTASLLICTHFCSTLLPTVAVAHVAANHWLPWKRMTSGRFVTAIHCQCERPFMNCVLMFFY